MSFGASNFGVRFGTLVFLEDTLVFFKTVNIVDENFRIWEDSLKKEAPDQPNRLIGDLIYYKWLKRDPSERRNLFFPKKMWNIGGNWNWEFLLGPC